MLSKVKNNNSAEFDRDHFIAKKCKVIECFNIV